MFFSSPVTLKTLSTGFRPDQTLHYQLAVSHTKQLINNSVSCSDYFLAECQGINKKNKTDMKENRGLMKNMTEMLHRDIALFLLIVISHTEIDIQTYWSSVIQK